MTTGERVLFDKAEELSTELAQEIKRCAKGTGSTGGLIIFTEARVKTILEVLRDIEYLHEKPAHWKGSGL